MTPREGKGMNSRIKRRVGSGVEFVMLVPMMVQKCKPWAKGQLGELIFGGRGTYKRNKKIYRNKLITKHTLFRYKTKFETLT